MPPTMSGKPRPPALFGSYEIGRSKRSKSPSPAFADGMKKGLHYEDTGDPGAYDPHMNSDLSASSSFSHNKGYKPFGSSSPARGGVGANYGTDSPGPGKYQDALAFTKSVAVVDDNRSVFNSTSLQRPKDDTPVPGPGAHSPNRNSVYKHTRNSGASMNGAGTRFAIPASQTDTHVNPHTYDAQMCYSGIPSTVTLESSKSRGKTSKTNPAFGTTSKQRPSSHMAPTDNPGPGTYDPLSPRVKNNLARHPSAGATDDGA